jgi:hypothetical protein
MAPFENDDSVVVEYLCPEKQLPGPHPTIPEILSSLDVRRHDEERELKIVDVGPFQIKFGPNLNLLEGRNMLFVKEKRPHVGVQVVYSLLRDLKHGLNFIVMERIVGGSLLSELWPGMCESHKTQVITELGGYVSQLRSIPSPGYFGSVDGSGLLDPTFRDGDRPERFATLDELILGHARATHLSPAEELETKNIVFTNPVSVFTVGVLYPKNIIVRANGELVLTAWGFAGWYPSCWEYVRAMAGWEWSWQVLDPDWLRRMDQYVMDQFVQPKSWFVKMVSQSRRERMRDMEIQSLQGGGSSSSRQPWSFTAVLRPKARNTPHTTSSSTEQPWSFTAVLRPKARNTPHTTSSSTENSLGPFPGDA